MTDRNYKSAVNLVIQAAQAGNPKHETILIIGNTPQLLLDNGYPDLRLIIKGKTVDKAHFDHGITKGVIERLGDIINSPKALYKSATVDDSAVVITFEMKAGSPILVPIHKNKPIGRASFANVVASIYTKEPTIEERWRAEGLLLWERQL